MKKGKKKYWLSAIFAGLGVILLIATGCVWYVFRNEPLDFEKIRRQIYDYEMYVSDLNLPAIEAEAESAFNDLRADGSFPDIDYSDTAQTNWKPAAHLNRLRNLVVSYVHPSGKYYQNHEAYSKIESGLRFWSDAKPVSTNWYMQEISSPQDVGAMLIMMRFGAEKIPQELEAAMLAHMEETAGDPRKMTGANKTDEAVHYIYRGALSEKSRPIKIGSREAFSTLCYTKKEGFQHDGSYQQHGAQLYITGYGNAIVNSLASVITAVDGTKYAVSAEQLEPLQNFMTEAYIRVARGQYRLYNSGGRSLSREGSLDVSGDVLMYEKLKYIDPSNADVYDAVIDRIQGNCDAGYLLDRKYTHFWRSDYSLYTSPGYTFDVRTVSDRTCRNENGNEENLKGYFLADGAYSITVDGAEYYNIFPVWDYAMIPGTTTPYLSEIPLPEPWGQYGQTAFAGGLSNGETGIAAYAYVDQDFGLDVQARKSYFMLGDCIVCLGSGIRGNRAGEMRTTLNQCLSEGEVYVVRDGGVPEVVTAEETVLGDDVKGIYHDQVGYVFYDGNPKTLTNRDQSGRWTDINTSQSNQELITKKVFTLYESHGERPDDGNYQYVILPGISSQQEVAAFDKSTVQILSNTETVQAVKTSGSDAVYAVFFGAGTLRCADAEISVDQPCALLLDGQKLYLSNPDQTVKKVNVSIRRDGTQAEKTVKFNSGKSELAGKTVVTELD